MDLNIRDFPDDVHSGLKSEAALQKTTLKELLICLLTEAEIRCSEERLREIEDDNCLREKYSQIK